MSIKSAEYFCIGSLGSPTRGGIDWNSLVVELFYTLVKVSIVDRTPNQKI